MSAQETRAEQRLASLAKEHRGMSASADVAAAIDIGRLTAPCHADILLALANGWPVTLVPLQSLHDRIEFEPRRP